MVSPRASRSVARCRCPKMAKGDLDFTVQFDSYEPFRTYDVLLETEDGGTDNGRAEDSEVSTASVDAPEATLILASVTVQAQPAVERGGVSLYLPLIAR